MNFKWSDDFFSCSDSFSCTSECKDAYFCIGCSVEYRPAAACEGGSGCEYVVYKKNVLAFERGAVGDAENVLDIFPAFFALFVCLCGVGNVTDDALAVNGDACDLGNSEGNVVALVVATLRLFLS